MTGLSLVASAALTLCGLGAILDGVDWWLRYVRVVWTASSILLIEYFGPAIWCFALAAWFALVATKRLESKCRVYSRIRGLH